MITIIDYGLGNVKAFENVYQNLNVPVQIGKDIKDIESADKLILPGVGAFDHAVQRLDQLGHRDVLNEMVLKRKIKILGVCVGMQLFAHASEEGTLPGLGWIDATVKKFDPGPSDRPVYIPHMGWNDIDVVKPNDLIQRRENQERFYFLHSYYIECRLRENIIAQTDYGDAFACAVHHDNIYGVQFHPEKSHHWGIRLLKRFAEL